MKITTPKKPTNQKASQNKKGNKQTKNPNTKPNFTEDQVKGIAWKEAVKIQRFDSLSA